MWEEGGFTGKEGAQETRDGSPMEGWRGIPKSAAVQIDIFTISLERALLLAHLHRNSKKLGPRQSGKLLCVHTWWQTALCDRFSHPRTALQD